MTGIEALIGVYAVTGLAVGYVVGYAVRGRRVRKTAVAPAVIRPRRM